jgi:hypothetical protein
MTDHEIRADERKRIADILEDIARHPDTDSERGLLFQEIAGVLRIPADDLIHAALIKICDEIRAEQKQ